jgi:MFS family permease
MTALLSTTVAYQLNASMLSPALETMARQLNTTEGAVGLSQTVFFTLAALFSLFLPRFSDIAGRRRVLCWALGITAVGSIICALASNVDVLLLGRAIQGVAGPVIQIALLILRVEIKDAKKYGVMLGIVTAVNGGIAGVDAIAGGFLVTHAGFRSIFWVIAVVAVISVLLVKRNTLESKPSAGTKMDWFGVIPLVISVAALLVGLNNAGRVAEANWRLVAVCVLVAIVAFAFFFLIEKHRKHPLVAPKYLCRRATWSLLLTTTLTLTGVYAAVYGVITSFVQNGSAGFGLRADVTSLVILTPFAIVGWIVGPLSGRLGPILGYRRVMRYGLIACIVALLVAGTVGLRSLWVLIVCVIVLGIAYVGTANIMLNGLGIFLSPPDNPGFLPGMNAGAFNLGAGLSFAVLTAIQVSGTPGGSSSSSGYSTAIVAGAAITGVALAVSFLVPKPPGDAEVG